YGGKFFFAFLSTLVLFGPLNIAISSPGKLSFHRETAATVDILPHAFKCVNVLPATITVNIYYIQQHFIIILNRSFVLAYTGV
ncbi:MAG: hypothetical protein QHH10_00970, partial [Peptococcaceae bacterium]|nr:hypothetical protein [Peptococcaceae bacterium]